MLRQGQDKPYRTPTQSLATRAAAQQFRLGIQTFSVGDAEQKDRTLIGVLKHFSLTLVKIQLRRTN